MMVDACFCVLLLLLCDVCLQFVKAVFIGISYCNAIRMRQTARNAK